MRKREIEKLLERAVAEALGVELKAPRKRETHNAVLQTARKRPDADHHHHRAAA